jgi:hypothetical protein
MLHPGVGIDPRIWRLEANELITEGKTIDTQKHQQRKSRRLFVVFDCYNGIGSGENTIC